MAQNAPPTFFFPQWIIVTLAIASLCGAVFLPMYALVYSDAFHSPWSRFWLCFLVGLLASIFFYALFPAYGGFTINFGQIAVPGPKVLAGPLALMFFISALLWHFVPQSKGRVFFANEGIYDARLIDFKMWEPHTPSRYLQLVNPIDRTLAGVYIEFEDPLVLTYRVRKPTLGDPPSNLKPIEFKLYPLDHEFALERLPP